MMKVATIVCGLILSTTLYSQEHTMQSSHALLIDKLSACSQQPAAELRLACFDSVTQQLSAADISEISSTAQAAVQTPEASVKAVPAATPVSTNKPTAVKTRTAESIGLSKQQQVDSFGKSQIEIVTIEKIESTFEGLFKGWKNGMIITLANGQKWKVISRSKGYTKLTNPAVEISEGILGSYDIRVEGFRPSAKVKRIE